MDNITITGVIFIWWVFLGPMIISSVVFLINIDKIEKEASYIMAASFFGYIAYAIPALIIGLFMLTIKSVPNLMENIVFYLLILSPLVASLFTFKYFKFKRISEK